MEVIKNSSLSSMKDKMRYSVLMCIYIHEEMGVRYFLQLRQQHPKFELPRTLSGFIPVQWLFNRLSWKDTMEGVDYWKKKANGIHGWVRFRSVLDNATNLVYEGTHHELDFF